MSDSAVRGKEVDPGINPPLEINYGSTVIKWLSPTDREGEYLK